MMPVLLSLDNRLQEQRIPDGARLRVPKLSLNAPPQGDAAAVSEAARMLVTPNFLCSLSSARPGPKPA
jgi:hypothetical protein